MEKWWEEDPFYVPIIKTLPPEEIYKTVVNTVYIYEKIYEQLPLGIITQDVTDGAILAYIATIPPETLFQNLTDAQKQYIKEKIPPEVIIQQLPQQIILQSISIVDIEYIIFSGDATTYNANSPTSGGTSLTSQERATNDDIVNVLAQMLRNADYMLILHGHANPVTGTLAEASQLDQISLARANAVKTKLETIYSGGVPLDTRITTKGYGGVRTVSTTGTSSTSSLNRRVEAILFTIDTTSMIGGG
jgi:outer membrane protein OmpA-like peptidoglycan-associated protein